MLSSTDSCMVRLNKCMVPSYGSMIEGKMSLTKLHNRTTIHKAAFRLTYLYLAPQGTLNKSKREAPRVFRITENTSADIG